MSREDGLSDETQRVILELKRVEQALKAREAELLEAQEVASIGSYALSIATDSWTSSAVLDSIFGIGAEFQRSVEGWSSLVHPADRAAMLDYFLGEVIGKRQPFDREYRIVRKSDEATRWVHGRGRLHFGDRGELVFMLGTIQDITERKRAEREKEALQAQLMQAQKMESIGRLAGGVAHDFNNMLGVILIRTEMAMGEVDPALPLHAHLEGIQKAAQRSASLTRQLLAFARQQPIVPRVLDLNEEVAGMLKMLWRLIGENIHLSWRPQAELWPVKVDPSQIDQILANLCVNARDAISGVGRITIETGNSIVGESVGSGHPGVEPGDYVRLSVSDDGCGMDQETQSHIFEPFFTTKGVGEGTGLGLATVYGAVRQNKGFIDVHSEPRGGATFAVYLPRHVGKVAPPKMEGAATALPRGLETILVVEDEPTILEISKLMLERQGYTVLAAATPLEALRLARERQGGIHLLMTDVVMPEMNGRELATRLLALHPGLKCLFMSGYTANVIARHGVLDEGMHFIQKPFTIPDLAAKVRGMLEGAE